MQGRTQDFKTGVTIWEGWRKRRFISGRWGKGLNKKAPMMPNLNNCNNNDARVYESKLGELVEASKDIGSCFFNGNVQGIQKLVGACEAKFGELVDIRSYFFNGNVHGIQKTSQGV